MSGHSKWASIKHKKAAVDAKKGKLFSRITKEITVAAKTGGGDPDANPRLRTAIAAARGASMPNDNIDRAIKRGTGDLPGVTYEEMTYEGYGPGGAAILVEVLTDNKNRTSAEIRSTFSKRGGSMAGAGSVAWIFERKGYITIEKEAASEDDIFMAATEAGAEDLKTEGGLYEIITPPEDLETVKEALEAAGIPHKGELAQLPKNRVKIEKKDATTLMRLIDELEENDDTQTVWSNFDIDEDILEEIYADSS